MNAFLHHSLVALIVISIVLHSSYSDKTRIIINDSSNSDENCTRLDNGTLVCPCNTEWNNTFYPCWMEIQEPGPQCIDCNPGSYSNISNNLTCNIDCVPGGCMMGVPCPQCPPGWAQPLPRQAECIECTSGYYSGTGAKTCTPCAPGSFVNKNGATFCNPCSAGNVQPANGSSSCIGCAAGTYSPNTGGTGCIGCGTGTYSPPGSSGCFPCPAGQYNAGVNASQCTPCPLGSVSEPGESSCSQCQIGQVPNPANSLCIPCGGGRFSDGPANECSSCQPGSFSPESATGNQLCYKCDPGNFANTPEATSCTPCQAGSYNNFPGARKCDPCPAGSYCPDTGMQAPKNCPPNFYCHEGATGPSQCATLYHSSNGGAKCSPSPSFYLIITGSILAFGVIALIAWRIRVSRRTEASKHNKSLEISRLIPKPREGPVYSGW